MRLLTLVFLLIAGSFSFAREVRLGQGIVCYDTSTTFLMRDSSSSCGSSTVFCSTPLSCFSPSTGQYLGGSLATCRAENQSSNTGSVGCPELQRCADDVRQEFIREDESAKWALLPEPPEEPHNRKEPPDPFIKEPGPGQDHIPDRQITMAFDLKTGRSF